MIERVIKVIGLTGGIGAGKSTVSRYLMKKNFPIIDADVIAREIVIPGSPILAELVSVFGEDILEKDGTLNRKGIAKIIFSDKQKKEWMEQIMHQEIARLIDLRIKEFRRSGIYHTIFVDVPLLFETKSGLAEIMDEIWLVDAEDEIRIARIMERDGNLRDDILARINNQMSREEKKKRTHVLIENSGSEDELYQKIDKLIQKL